MSRRSRSASSLTAPSSSQRHCIHDTRHCHCILSPPGPSCCLSSLNQLHHHHRDNIESTTRYLAIINNLHPLSTPSCLLSSSNHTKTTKVFHCHQLQFFGEAPIISALKILLLLSDCNSLIGASSSMLEQVTANQTHCQQAITIFVHQYLSN